MCSYGDLFLTARLAVGLHCFSSYCDGHRLEHESVDALLDYLWAFPVAIGDPESFVCWERDHAYLVNVGLGDEMSKDVEQALHDCEIAPAEFRRLLGSLVEIVFSSFYGATQNEESLQFLCEVMSVTSKHGVSAPPPEIFSESLIADCQGWGLPLTEAVRDRWRFANGYFPNAEH